MKAEAEANAEADKKEREVADAINKGDQLIFAQEKLIEEQKDNITSDEKSKLEGLVSSFKDAVAAKDVNKINEIEKTINDTWNEISQRIYASQQTQQTSQATEEAAASEPASEQPEVQDAEFEEVS